LHACSAPLSHLLKVLNGISNSSVGCSTLALKKQLCHVSYHWIVSVGGAAIK
jgi:hypothetical protein